MKTIKDPVHGDIQVSPEILHLLDSHYLQRLRYIRQLGFSFLVYPGAQHTRFEHSLGTMHLAGLLADHIELSGPEKLLVTASALLHDIGHGPFSHAAEGLIMEILHREHTEILDLLKGPELSTILQKIGLLPDDVYEMISGTHPLGSIIHGDLDVDRMDYLLRDAHYTGTPYGTVDALRLIRSTNLVDGKITLHESGIQAAESLLIARTLMRPAVYYHHVSRIGEKMFSAALYAHIKPDMENRLKDLYMADDSACMQTLLQSDIKTARNFIKDLYERKLYKRVLYAGHEEAAKFRQPDNSIIREHEIATEIAEKAGVSPDKVLVDIPAYPKDMWMEVQVQGKNQLIPLEDVSPLITTLNETRRRQWMIGVYAQKDCKTQIREAAREVFDLKLPTRQKRLI